MSSLFCSDKMYYGKFTALYRAVFLNTPPGNVYFDWKGNYFSVCRNMILQAKWTWKDMGPCLKQVWNSVCFWYTIRACQREDEAGSTQQGVNWHNVDHLGLIIELDFKKNPKKRVSHDELVSHLKSPVWAQGAREGEAVLKAFLQLRSASLSSPLVHKCHHLIAEISGVIRHHWQNQFGWKSPREVIESSLWPIPTIATSPECHAQTFLKHLPNGASTAWAAQSSNQPPSLGRNSS